MKTFHSMFFPVALSIVVAAEVPAMAAPADDIQKATRTFQEFVNSSERRIPPSLLQDSNAIAIIPNIIRAGFIFGGRRGDGILMVRNADGKWSDPAFVNITGGSIGLQAGAEASDVILVFRNKQNVAQLLDRKIELGGDVSVAAGPIGKDIVSGIDTSPAIYSYTRNKGLFGGVALSGVDLSYDKKQSEEFYGQDNITVRDIISNSRSPEQPVVTNLKTALTQYAVSGNASSNLITNP